MGHIDVEVIDFFKVYMYAGIQADVTADLCASVFGVERTKDCLLRMLLANALFGWMP